MPRDSKLDSESREGWDGACGIAVPSSEPGVHSINVCWLNFCSLSTLCLSLS